MLTSVLEKTQAGMVETPRARSLWLGGRVIKESSLEPSGVMERRKYLGRWSDHQCNEQADRVWVGQAGLGTSGGWNEES